MRCSPSDVSWTSSAASNSRLVRPAGYSVNGLAGGGTIYGMNKTTVYLPEALKQGVERLARQRSCSEAEVIRRAIQDAIARPKPRGGIIPGDSAWAEQADDYLAGFGER